MNDLSILKNKKDSNELKKIAEEETHEILQKLDGVCVKIDSAREDIISAKSIKGLLKGKDRDVALAEAQLEQLDVMSEMNDLIRKSMVLTCYTAEFAKVMGESLAFAMTNGFEDSNGKHVELSESSKKQAKIILESTNAFVERAIESDAKMKEIKSEIESVKDEIKVLSNARNIIEDSIKDVKSNVQGNFTAISNFERKIYEVNSTIDKINDKIDNLSRLESQVNEIYGKLSEIESQNKENSSRLDNTISNQQELEHNIDDIENSFEEKLISEKELIFSKFNNEIEQLKTFMNAYSNPKNGEDIKEGGKNTVAFISIIISIIAVTISIGLHFL